MQKFTNLFIVETKKNSGDIWDWLISSSSIQEGVKKAQQAWNDLAPQDKKNSIIELAAGDFLRLDSGEVLPSLDLEAYDVIWSSEE